MHAYDFIKQNIGVRVYLSPHGDLAFYRELRPFIKYAHNDNPRCLWIDSLTKGGMAKLYDGDGNYYKVAPSSVVEAVYRPNVETSGYAIFGRVLYLFVKSYDGWEELKNVHEINAYGKINECYAEPQPPYEYCNPYKIKTIRYCGDGVDHELFKLTKKDEPELIIEVESIHETDCLNGWSWDK